MQSEQLKGKRVLVLAEDIYEDLELWYPTLRLREEGAEVTLAGPERGTYRGKHGYPVSVDTEFDQLSASDFDAVVIPGGYAPDRIRRNANAVGVVADMNAAGKTIAAICHAAWVPISAGILDGRRMTCFHAIKDDVINAGAEYVDEQVVVDGNLITSRKPDDLGAFCRAIIGRLLEQSA
jgi:protease I